MLVPLGKQKPVVLFLVYSAAPYLVYSANVFKFKELSNKILLLCLNSEPGSGMFCTDYHIPVYACSLSSSLG